MGLSKEDQFRRNYRLVAEFVRRHPVGATFDQELYESKVAFVLWRVIDNHNPDEGTLSTLFYAYAHNARVDHLRDQSRRGFRRCPAAMRRVGMSLAPLTADPPAKRPEVPASAAEETWDVIRRAAEDDVAVRALRARLVLRATYIEIAREEGLNVRHLMGRVSRAVKRVQKKKDQVYTLLGMEG